MVAGKAVLDWYDLPLSSQPTSWMLISADIPKPHLTRIIESFLNEQKPSDGEIFRKIRLYHRQNDVEAENRWWACLDKSKLRDLRQLLKKQEIAAAFDDLIDLPGLWGRIQLGAIQRLLALKCDEVGALRQREK